MIQKRKLWKLAEPINESDFKKEIVNFFKENKTFYISFDVDLGCYDFINKENLFNRVSTFGCSRKYFEKDYTQLVIYDLHDKKIVINIA